MNVSNWQKRLLPFLVSTISVLAVVFITFFFIEINSIQNAMVQPPEINTATKEEFSSMDERKWDNVYQLEKFTLSNRYYHARLIIRTRILIVSLSFLTGVTLCIIGAIFILGKFSENATEIGGTLEKANLKLISSSPGIILSTLGIILISISIFSKTDLNITDTPLYVPEWSNQTIEQKTGSQVLDNKSLQNERDVDSIKKKRIDSLLNKLAK